MSSLYAGSSPCHNEPFLCNSKQTLPCICASWQIRWGLLSCSQAYSAWLSAEAYSPLHPILCVASACSILSEYAYLGSLCSSWRLEEMAVAEPHVAQQKWLELRWLSTWNAAFPEQASISQVTSNFKLPRRDCSLSPDYNPPHAKTRLIQDIYFMQDISKS